MKHLMLLITVLLVALLALSSLRCDAMEPIYDTDGQELRDGVGYYIIPADRNLGGGLDLDAVDGDSQCPPRVRFSGNAQYHGFPVLITPWNALAGADGTLLLLADVEIRFNYTWTACGAGDDLGIRFNYTWTACGAGDDLGWHLHRQDGDMQWHVAAGARDRLHPLSTKMFRVESHGDGAPEGYKLASCAGWPDDGRHCHDLGLYLGARGMKRWLVASADKPLVVVFKKFTSQSARHT